MQRAGQGKVWPKGAAHDIDVLARIHSNPSAIQVFVGGTADNRIELNSRIDYQRLPPVIAGDFKMNILVRADTVMRGDFHLPSTDLLVYLGLLLQELTGGRGQNQIAGRIGMNSVHAIEGEFNPARVRARGDHEIVFELPLVAVKHHVHARVYALAFHPGVLGDIFDPFRGIVADEVVADTGQAFHTLVKAALRVDGPHADDGFLWLLLQFR